MHLCVGPGKQPSRSSTPQSLVPKHLDSQASHASSTPRAQRDASFGLLQAVPPAGAEVRSLS